MLNEDIHMHSTTYARKSIILLLTSLFYKKNQIIEFYFINITISPNILLFLSSRVSL